MTSIPQPMPTYLSGLAPDYDRPPAGGFIATRGTNTAPSSSTLGTAIDGGHIFIPAPVVATSFGFAITGAGDASAVCFISLYGRAGVNFYQQVIAEQQLNVGIATGVQQVTLTPAVPLAAGHYIAFIRATASTTFPVTTTTVGVAGGPDIYPSDVTEASSDFARGGVHNSQVSGYSGSGPPPATFNLIAGTRAIATRLFLGVQ